MFLEPAIDIIKTIFQDLKYPDTIIHTAHLKARKTFIAMQVELRLMKK